MAHKFGYGGSNALSVAPGGFVGSLALYDSTGFCDDPSLSIFGVAGKYALALSVQPNDSPMFIVDNYNLLAGANYGSVVFVDPGDFTGQTLRSGNWKLQEDLDGGTAVPEPASLPLSAVGLSALIAIRRTKSTMRRFAAFTLLMGSLSAFGADGLLTGDVFIATANAGGNFGSQTALALGSGGTGLVQFSGCRWAELVRVEELSWYYQHFSLCPV